MESNFGPDFHNGSVVLDEVSNIHWHFINLGGVVLLNVPGEKKNVITKQKEGQDTALLSSKNIKPIDLTSRS